ncbi:MAG: DUF2157 domain-containing protein [Crocinitomicaceae bacterium]|nr:DUF2157 domain-containing protein [Flavobacteriales bacterium]NQZ34089.1 DUF2157 domain-containing protein [Crocinitomicaceae bacterium]
MNSTQLLLNFADKIEQREIVNQKTAIKMRNYIRKLEDSTPIELFLIISGIMGALFCAAGIFALISHNWDEYPKYIRGAFSVVPALGGLYFYYRAIFHHPKSRPWIEASSVFLMLMIGASIALVSQTYQLDGDFNKFIKVWAVLTLPLFYFARASGITILYLGLISVLAVQVSLNFFGLPRFGENVNNIWYWVLLLGFLPHYYLALKKESRSQSIRIVYMSYVVYLSFMLALMMTIKGNYILWIAVANVGFYIFGTRFMGENVNIIKRPFQLLSQTWIVLLLLSLSNKDSLRFGLKSDSFLNLFKSQEDLPYQYLREIDPNEGKMFYFVLLILVLSVIYFIYFYFRKHFIDVSKLLLFTPVYLFVLMICHEYIFPHWFIVMLVNGYILLLGINALMRGSENQNIAQMVGGFFLISALLWIRYFDTDWNFIMKGLMFIGIGGTFFLINLSQKSKLERIERNKTRRDDY